jgi:hypothetical protein
MKPLGYVETNHLMEFVDKTEMARHILGMFTALYGVCEEDSDFDLRTGEIELTEWGQNHCDFNKGLVVGYSLAE